MSKTMKELADNTANRYADWLCDSTHGLKKLLQSEVSSMTALVERALVEHENVVREEDCGLICDWCRLKFELDGELDGYHIVDGSFIPCKATTIRARKVIL